MQAFVTPQDRAASCLPSLLCNEAMTSNFPSLEKDPLFFTAEQVQDAADRLELAYRAWMHAKSLSLKSQDNSILDFCRRELSTALGIAKWQIEEFEKEVSLLTMDTQQQHGEDDTPQRHRQFIDAISNQLSSIKNVLLSSKDERDLNVLPAAVRLGQEESDQLAHFLCGSRLNTSEDAKDMLSRCTISGKGYKDMVTLCQSATSMCSSGLDDGKALFGSLDECSSSPDTRISVDTNELLMSKDHIVNRPEINWATGDFVCISGGNQSDVALTCAASDLLIDDCYDSAGTCIERLNGHWRSTSLGGGLSLCTERANGHHRAISVDPGVSCWRDGSSTSESKSSPNHGTGNTLSNFWNSVLKASLICWVGGPSSNGLKRWKDGE